MRYFVAIPMFALAAVSAARDSFAARVDTPIVTGSASIPVAAADLDGDGRADLVVGHRPIPGVAGERHGATVMRSRGDGTFTQIRLNYPDFSARSVLLIDVNRDGRLDAVTHYMAADGLGEVLVQLGRGGVAFGPRIRVPGPDSPRRVAAADMNGDGILDLVVANSDMPGLYVIRGAGDGTFVSPRVFPGLTGVAGLAVGDVNRDGRPDVLLLRGSSLAVHLNNGAGGFRPVVTQPIGAAGNALALADLDRDGRLDAVVASASTSTVRVLYGRGTGAFAAPIATSVGAPPTDLAIGRMNGDVWLDVATVSRDDSSVRVLYGRPARRLLRGPRMAVGAGASSVAIGDVSGDGRQDIVTGNPTAGSVTTLITE